MTGFHTRCILCMPIKNGEGEVLAVAQVVNKLPPGSSLPSAADGKAVAAASGLSSSTSSELKEEEEEGKGEQQQASADYPVFTDHDVSVFKAYTAFCGIGLHHAQILWKSQLETKRSQVSP
ncbi:unnamed protein product [Dibothriocephalus latus]|uniref:GAF domain-containing protein n=1 Tax=Dibothriocephalus latus TaxID=60516 RepID=A0A3P7LT25_DIBLA|nr:unnamed protein product [Dibothriocephalus latus]